MTHSSGAGQGETPPAALHGMALAAAVLTLVLWAGFTVLMIVNTGTDNDIQWTRLAYLFASVEAVAFGAAGALWGTSINRQRAEQAEQRASTNEREAASGRALATSQIAEAEAVVTKQSNGRLQGLGAGQASESDAVLVRHASQARMLFPDI